MFSGKLYKKTTQGILVGVETLRDELEHHADQQDKVAEAKEQAAAALYDEAKNLRFDAAQARTAAASINHTLESVMYDA